MGEAEEEEVQEAEEAGARKRKRGAGGEAEGDASGVEDAAEGGAYDKEDLLVEDGAGEGIAEEAVAEVMRWLEAEIAGPPPAGPGFVTINGNEESCGPSFSAAASTVMASVDTRAGAPPPPPVPWPWPDPVPAAGGAGVGAPAVEDVEMVGPGGEADEEWLASLLTCAGPLLEGVLLL
ncbi:E3 ubiquitin-protein ligase TRIM33 [Panicum virgatum]|uniref:Uncharacterized protein n=1 Tax=Panicum virgatum TaxID=38727 RepID=A0A8T0RLS1_PANVG|nr:E3 ubiquitin-protein ligase TRIM33 [Panicum virgatum]KAG2586384.1 hypothetical protein PVAP13_5NG053500 [Panicum virgatum]